MPRGNRSYKELTFQQLRSLCETARQGSFLAAAGALELSQPTVWKQVHALEREFGAKLVEPHGRGCALTPAGRLLVQMVGPAVESIAAVRERFRAALAEEGEELALAVTPRMLLDDIAPCVRWFHTASPKTRFLFLELSDAEVAGAVLERHVDFGFTPTPLMTAQVDLLSAEPAYSLEVRLITPKDHPLARRRVVRPADLGGYPIVNRAPVNNFNSLTRLLHELKRGRRETTGLVHAGFASSIRRFVKMGYGVGLLTVVPSVPPDADLHERSMSRYLESIPVSLIRRRGSYLSTTGEEFIQLVRQELNPGPGRRR